ncbi:MAG TPA: hypothetical protein VM029_18325 [Opitutaceae bacterium]|nr:hypothetical protein [Opitutaceae bacterium]
MQRSKQHALMFLLGATLVGGVLGFSAERVFSKKPQRPGPRVQMYDDIGIDSAQRVKMDSVLDETNCKLGDVSRPLRPRMDSIRADGFATIRELMTPAQREAFNAREKRMRAKMDSTEKAHDAEWAKAHPGTERPRRCGPGGPRGGASGQPDRGGPRPFL